MTEMLTDFVRNALNNSRTDEAVFHLNLGHAALELGMPEEALNQYKQSQSKQSESSQLSIIDIEGALDRLLNLHPNLQEPVIIRKTEVIHPAKSILLRVFENTAVRLLSIFVAGFTFNSLI